MTVWKYSTLSVVLELYKNWIDVTMPSNTTPQPYLTVWDKATIHALNRLACASSITWFNMVVIVNRVTAYADNYINVHYERDIANAVRDSLSRLGTLDIVSCEQQNVLNYMLFMRKLNTNLEAVERLARAIQLELAETSNFNDAGREQESRIIYTVLFNTHVRLHRPTTTEFLSVENSMETAYSQRREQAIRELGLV